MPQTRNFAQQRLLGRPRGPSPCAGPDNGGSQSLTIACKQNNLPTVLLQCKNKGHVAYCCNFTSLTFATQPAGPWIQTRSRRGTQAWQFLSNEVPIALQVYLKTLRCQQHQPHNPELANTSPHESRQQASQASESARLKNTKSNNEPKFITAIHPAAHLMSRPAQGPPNPPTTAPH